MLLSAASPAGQSADLSVETPVVRVRLAIFLNFGVPFFHTVMGVRADSRVAAASGSREGGGGMTTAVEGETAEVALGRSCL